MLKSFVKTVVGGAIGLVALYVVGKVAYQAGHDIAEAEYRRDAAQPKTTEKEPEIEESSVDDSGEEETTEVAAPVKKQSRISMALGLWKALKKKETSAISDLIQNPENHVIEACIKGREIHVNVKPRTA